MDWAPIAGVVGERHSPYSSLRCSPGGSGRQARLALGLLLDGHFTYKLFVLQVPLLVTLGSSDARARMSATPKYLCT